MKIVKYIMVTALCIILTSLFVVAGIVLIMSPGKPKQLRDDNGKVLERSISEKLFLEINGVKQGMFIIGTDSSKPVLLYLHGGLPDYFLSKIYPTGLEDYFTMVWWEQRGSGISFSPDIPDETKNPDQLVSDVITVSNYLRTRFGQEKIYLMGHSGGSFIGIKAVERFPDLYKAYIGVSQMSDQLSSEIEAYQFMLEKYRESGNKSMLRKLEGAPVNASTGTPKKYLFLRDVAMHDLGIGTMHNMRSVMSGVFLPTFACRDYTISEKINMWRGKARSGVSMIWGTMLKSNLSDEIHEILIPVYFFHGVYDYTCSYKEARKFYNQLKAPVKGFYTFDLSAHSPIFEEPGKVQMIMESDVLRGRNDLADNDGIE
jgi:pimeloyl-ACP methyl ester carboxylesterase